MRERSVLCLGPSGHHTLAYTEWGDPSAPAVVCVHGLTRNGRDFDTLAAHLADRYRVICPDVAGRGKSGWLADPLQYGYPQYMADMTALIARLDVETVDWIGTSMGGLIGMMLAAVPGTPIRRLLINDVGPFLPKTALQRIAGYLLLQRTFDDLGALEAHLREVHAPFGPLSDDQWAHLAAHSGKQSEDGTWRMHYDPAIAAPFRDVVNDDIDIWSVWDSITCPVHVIRGETSDILLAETAREMTTRGPQAQVTEITGVGHAPALMATDQIGIIDAWLA